LWKSHLLSICGNHTFCQISGGDNFSLAIDSAGKAWAWGDNESGELGHNNTICYSTPVAVCGGHTFCHISAGVGEYSLAIDNYGKAWAWGYGSFGRLGNNSIVNRSTPVAVCGNHTFCQISGGGNFSLAIDSAGKAWAWGSNSTGQLGNNTSGDGTHKSTPVAVYGGHTFCHISAGSYYFSLAIDNYGKAWAWGYNNYGQLGTNNLISYSTPVAVCGGHTFCHISAGS